MAFGMNNPAFENDNMAFVGIKMALKQKGHANSSWHATFCVQLLYFYRVRCLELE